MIKAAITSLIILTLLSTLSLSLQQFYVDYWCSDTQEYLTIANRKITVCGKTCDFEIKNPHTNQSKSTFNYNQDAPPLYFEWNSRINLLQHLTSRQQGSWSNSYAFLFSTDIAHPPTC